MRKVILSVMVSLDGFFDAPGEGDVLVVGGIVGDEW